MSIQGLLNSLNGLSDLHEEMLGLASQKRKLIVENRVDQLMTFSAKENKAIAVMEKYNKEIHQFTHECWADLGIVPKPSSTLADLLQAVVWANGKVALTAAAERLKSSVQKLKEMNERNQILVRQSLEYIEFQIDLFTAPYDDITYSPTKSGNTAGNTRRTFDTRA